MRESIKKSLIQKIIYIILLIVICSFIIPNYVHAAVEKIEIGLEIDAEEGDRI